MYNIGDKIVHPMHGAGVIERMETRIVDGSEKEYYVMRMPACGMMVMVPEENAVAIGVRPVVSRSAALELIGEIRGLRVDMDNNWSRRYRENMDRLKSGELIKVVYVIKGLTLRERLRNLSTGERKMLHLAKQILISELVLALSRDYDTIESEIDSLLK